MFYFSYIFELVLHIYLFLYISKQKIYAIKRERESSSKRERERERVILGRLSLTLLSFICSKVLQVLLSYPIKDQSTESGIFILSNKSLRSTKFCSLTLPKVSAVHSLYHPTFLCSAVLFPSLIYILLIFDLQEERVEPPFLSRKGLKNLYSSLRIISHSLLR